MRYKILAFGFCVVFINDLFSQSYDQYSCDPENHWVTTIFNIDSLGCQSGLVPTQSQRIEYSSISFSIDSECKLDQHFRIFDSLNVVRTIDVTNYKGNQVYGQILQGEFDSYLGIALLNDQYEVIDYEFIKTDNNFVFVDNLRDHYFGDTLAWYWILSNQEDSSNALAIRVWVYDDQVSIDLRQVESFHVSSVQFAGLIPYHKDSSYLNYSNELMIFDHVTGSFIPVVFIDDNGEVRNEGHMLAIAKSKRGLIQFDYLSNIEGIRLNEIIFSDNIAISEEVFSVELDISQTAFMGIRSIGDGYDKLLYASYFDKENRETFWFAHLDSNHKIIRSANIDVPSLFGCADADYELLNYHFVGYYWDFIPNNLENVYFRIPEDSEVFTTSTADLNDLEDVSVIYPNPTSDILNIQVQQVTEIQAINTLGQMTTLEVSNQVVSTKRLEPGVYSILGFDNQGQLLMKDRFIKVD